MFDGLYDAKSAIAGGATPFQRGPARVCRWRWPTWPVRFGRWALAVSAEDTTRHRRASALGSSACSWVRFCRRLSNRVVLVLKRGLSAFLSAPSQTGIKKPAVWRALEIDLGVEHRGFEPRTPCLPGKIRCVIACRGLPFELCQRRVVPLSPASCRRNCGINCGTLATRPADRCKALRPQPSYVASAATGNLCAV
jgi:hypothetical protein